MVQAYTYTQCSKQGLPACPTESAESRHRQAECGLSFTDGLVKLSAEENVFGEFVYSPLRTQTMYILTYLHTYIHTYAHTYMHAYIPARIHTYMHTCIQSICIWSSSNIYDSPLNFHLSPIARVLTKSSYQESSWCSLGLCGFGHYYENTKKGSKASAASLSWVYTFPVQHGVARYLTSGASVIQCYPLY